MDGYTPIPLLTQDVLVCSLYHELSIYVVKYYITYKVNSLFCESRHHWTPAITHGYKPLSRISIW